MTPATLHLYSPSEIRAAKTVKRWWKFSHWKHGETAGFGTHDEAQRWRSYLCDLTTFSGSWSVRSMTDDEPIPAGEYDLTEALANLGD